MRMLLGSKKYLKFKVKTVMAGYCISLNCRWHWWTRWSFSLPDSCVSMSDCGIRGHSKTMFFSIGERGVFKWEGGTRDKKAAVLFYISLKLEPLRNGQREMQFLFFAGKKIWKWEGRFPSWKKKKKDGKNKSCQQSHFLQFSSNANVFM